MEMDTKTNDAPLKVPKPLVPVVSGLVHKLVVGEYEDLIRTGVAEGWTLEYLPTYMKEMETVDGAPLADLPDAFFEEEDTTLALGNGRYSVWVRLWTTRGPSAYSLIIDFDPTPTGFEAHFENLEIM